MQNSYDSKIGRNRAISLMWVAVLIIIIIIAIGGVYFLAYNYMTRQPSTRPPSISGSGLDQAGFGTSIIINPDAQSGELGFSLVNVGINSVRGISINIFTESGVQLASIQWAGDVVTNKTLTILANDTGIYASTGNATGTVNIPNTTVSPGSMYKYDIIITFSDGTTQSYQGSGEVSPHSS